MAFRIISPCRQNLTDQATIAFELPPLQHTCLLNLTGDHCYARPLPHPHPHAHQLTLALSATLTLTFTLPCLYHRCLHHFTDESMDDDTNSLFSALTKLSKFTPKKMATWLLGFLEASATAEEVVRVAHHARRLGGGWTEELDKLPDARSVMFEQFRAVKQFESAASFWDGLTPFTPASLRQMLLPVCFAKWGSRLITKVKELVDTEFDDQLKMKLFVNQVRV